MKALVLIFTFAASAFATDYPLTGLDAVDGDTVSAEIEVGFDITLHKKIRLARVDTAELHSKDAAQRESALKAKAFLVAILEKGDCRLASHKNDKYGRVLGEITCEGVNASDALLKAGLARPYSGGKR